MPFLDPDRTRIGAPSLCCAPLGAFISILPKAPDTHILNLVGPIGPIVAREATRIAEEGGGGSLRHTVGGCALTRRRTKGMVGEEWG
jgi:hypothetical protein